jgi:iron complex transport system substrate-binding protein
MKRMSILRTILAMLLAACAVHAAAEGAAPIRITDDLGRTLQWSAPPRRIVTLMPSLTESVCALGACDRLVGVDRYSNHPAQVGKLPKLGSLDDAQVEAIVVLRPDVVILSPLSNAQERLSALGLKVLVLETRDQADIRHVLLTLGTLLAHPDPLAVWRAIDTEVARAAATVPASMRGRRVYYEVDDGPYAAGAASYLGQVLARLGLRNIVGEELGPFPKLNPEFVVRADPQIIMLGRHDAVDLARRPGWAQIDAVKHRAVCVFTPEESEVMGRPGPRMAAAALTMARCLRDLARSPQDKTR